MAPSSTHPLFAGRVIDLKLLKREPRQELPWLIPGLLCHGAVTVLVGEGGTGKTMLAQSIASAAQGSGDIGPLQVNCAKPVLYLDAEQAAVVVQERLHLLNMRTFGISYLEADGLHLVRDADALVEAINEISPGLVVFDSFKAMTPGVDENGGEVADAMQTLGRIAKLPCCPAVLALAHTGKDAGRGHRGHSSMRDRCDIMVILERKDAKDQKVMRLSWQSPRGKMRLGEAPTNLGLTFEVVGGRIQWRPVSLPGEDRREQIVSYFNHHSAATMAEAARALGEISDSGKAKTAFVGHVKDLVDEGRLRRIGPERGALYESASRPDPTAEVEGVDSHPVSQGSECEPESPTGQAGGVRTPQRDPDSPAPFAPLALPKGAKGREPGNLDWSASEGVQGGEVLPMPVQSIPVPPRREKNQVEAA